MDRASGVVGQLGSWVASKWMGLIESGIASEYK
jgi:hypothetical protein